eukprot:4159510-Prymnesium_polylepis.1
MDLHESATLSSCFFFCLSPMILTSPSLASRHDSSPPPTKWGSTSPNDLPSGVVPVLRSRRSLSAPSTAACH